jgi:ribose 5-phosphate isomerase B
MTKKIVIGSDHAAFLMKEFVKKILSSKGYDVQDVGPQNEDRCDYPDYAIELSKVVVAKNIPGILLCGSGIGVSIVANRFCGVRAALCRTSYDAEMSRKHNDANVLCLGARVNSELEIEQIVTTWLSCEFEGGRHGERLAIFAKLGEKA